ncbi:MAG: helix-turn-helix transcriptional regulator [Oscillospiraceae bacterium]|nr:helix-turn-helix transcriptional regulator [Oscillospiraceae bacterium]
MANKVGPLIKEARGKANLSQESLAGKIDGLSAADLSKAEHGEKELSQSVLRQIAKLTGVTQSSLVNAAKESTYGAAKKPAAKKTTAKKTAAAKNAVELTAAEKKLLELYRAADSETKKKAVAVLKGEEPDAGNLLGSLLGGDQAAGGDIIGSIIDTAFGMLGKK